MHTTFRTYLQATILSLVLRLAVCQPLSISAQPEPLNIRLSKRMPNIPETIGASKAVKIPQNAKSSLSGYRQGGIAQTPESEQDLALVGKGKNSKLEEEHDEMIFSMDLDPDDTKPRSTTNPGPTRGLMGLDDVRSQNRVYQGRSNAINIPNKNNANKQTDDSDSKETAIVGGPQLSRFMSP